MDHAECMHTLCLGSHMLKNLALTPEIQVCFAHGKCILALLKGFAHHFLF